METMGPAAIRIWNGSAKWVSGADCIFRKTTAPLYTHLAGNSIFKAIYKGTKLIRLGVWAPYCIV